MVSMYNVGKVPGEGPRFVIQYLNIFAYLYVTAQTVIEYQFVSWSRTTLSADKTV
jgi:hypothetical protein